VTVLRIVELHLSKRFAGSRIATETDQVLPRSTVAGDPLAQTCAV